MFTYAKLIEKRRKITQKNINPQKN